MLSTCFLPVTAAVMGGGAAASGEIRVPHYLPSLRPPAQRSATLSLQHHHVFVCGCFLFVFILLLITLRSFHSGQAWSAYCVCVCV